MTQKAPIALRVCSFRGLQNLPIYVALLEGYFASEGLAVELSYTTGSAPQLAGLARGAYDLVQTAPDNVIKLDDDPAAFGLDPAAPPRAVMVAGGSNGPLSVYAAPGLRDASNLRGTVLGVDHPASGFALVLRDLLARRGLHLGSDYQVVAAGSTDARCEALVRGQIAATILYTPFDLQAAAAGCVRLASSADAYPAYASSATTGLEGWIEEHADTVTRYVRAVLRGLRWIHAPANAPAARRVLQDEPALALSEPLAAHAYAAFVAPETGFGEQASLDERGLQQVIELRRAYGQPRGELGQPASYLDTRWHERARLSL